MSKANSAVCGSKDVIQKILLDKNEVFADVLNGFIFNGKRVIKPEMLADTNTSSYYKANGEIHGQDRDVAKLLTIDKTKVVISLVGIENQTRPDKHMPARVMNYDAAAYRYQLTKSKTLYPVLTLVVYYGKEAWSYNRNLLGNINMQKLPKEMRPLISDYEIKAFYRISDLSAQELDKRFRSAFFCLAEYFIQTNAGEEYHPSAKKLSIEDILLLLDMMNALSGTHAYDELIKELGKRNKNEVTTMTEVLPEFMQVKIDRARKETTEKVTKETTEKVTKDYLINILSTTNLTPDGAMDLLGIPKDDRPMYKDLLKKK
ncbi:MAG: Rpn family recombination-promoting nuclease/putative transposase [Lactobacillus sp.]|jgi:hypothetical protein